MPYQIGLEIGKNPERRIQLLINLLILLSGNCKIINLPILIKRIIEFILLYEFE